MLCTAGLFLRQTTHAHTYARVSSLSPPSGCLLVSQCDGLNGCIRTRVKWRSGERGQRTKKIHTKNMGGKGKGRRRKRNRERQAKERKGKEGGGVMVPGCWCWSVLVSLLFSSLHSIHILHFQTTMNKKKMHNHIYVYVAGLFAAAL